MQQRVYECRLNNVDELKQRLAYAWKGMQQNVIDSAISEWRRDCKRAYVHRDDILDTHCKAFLMHTLIKTA